MKYKKIYGNMAAPYSVLNTIYKGKKLIISASEAEGGDIMVVEAETGVKRMISSLPGGIMSIVPVVGHEGTFLAITKFFPIFRSREAEIVCIELGEPEEYTWPVHVRTLTKLPYVHRIALNRSESGYNLICAALCRDKDFVEDWTKPGAVYVYQLDEQINVLSIRKIISDLTKNHGMFAINNTVYISAENGIWAINEDCKPEKICDEPAGDLCLYDVDGDGEDEILCITPFHGDGLHILKKRENRWDKLAEAGLTFGHAVWCGRFGGEVCIIVCSRGGDAKIQLFRVHFVGGNLELCPADIDSGVGSTNISVEAGDNCLTLYSANHGSDEVAVYKLDAKDWID